MVLYRFIYVPNDITAMMLPLRRTLVLLVFYSAWCSKLIISQAASIQKASH